MKLARSSSLVFTLLVALSVRAANAQSWADQLFDTRHHDFGNVARNSQLKKTFVVKNTLDRPVHIYGNPRPSCSVCTVAKLEKEWLQPGESTTIEANINTLTVDGRKDVAITVTFDRPAYAEVRLTLTCYSRRDIVLNPGEFAFGTIKRGKTASKTMDIEYAGSNDWEIKGATTANAHVETELTETHRGNGRVGYRLRVTLKPEAPSGFIRERILLGVSDAYNRSGIDVALQANVQSDVSISASQLDLGSVVAGSTTTKQVLVRGVRPFRIVAIESNDGHFHIEKPEEAKQLHMLTVTLKAGEEPAELNQEFEIQTDMPGEERLTLAVSARVVADQPVPKPDAR